MTTAVSPPERRPALVWAGLGLDLLAALCLLGAWFVWTGLALPGMVATIGGFLCGGIGEHRAAPGSAARRSARRVAIAAIVIAVLGVASVVLVMLVASTATPVD